MEVTVEPYWGEAYEMWRNMLWWAGEASLSLEALLLFTPKNIQSFESLIFDQLWLVIWGIMWYIRNVYWQKQVQDWFFSQVFHPKSFCLSCGSLSGLLLWLSSPAALGNLISPGTGDAGINRYLPVSTLLDLLEVSDVLPSIWGGLLIFQVWLSHIPVTQRKMKHQLKQKSRI